MMIFDLEIIIRTWQQAVFLTGTLAVVFWMLLNANILKLTVIAVILTSAVYLIYHNQNILLKGVLTIGF